jgi:hypothetical protein
MNYQWVVEEIMKDIKQSIKSNENESITYLSKLVLFQVLKRKFQHMQIKKYNTAYRQNTG